MRAARTLVCLALFAAAGLPVVRTAAAPISPGPQEPQASGEDRTSLAREIDTLARESRELLDKAKKVSTPTADLLSLIGFVEANLARRPKEGEPIDRLREYRDRLRVDKDDLAGAILASTSASSSAPPPTRPPASPPESKQASPPASKQAPPPASKSTSAPGAKRTAPASRPVPGYLVRAFEAFRQGHYDEVESVLAAAPAGGDRERFQVHLFRAASLHARYLLGGASDDELIRQAEILVRECRRIDPQRTPNDRVFGPRFVTFYLGTPAS